MRTWRTKSWSKQARRMSNTYIEYISCGDTTYEKAKEMISASYRAPIIRQRALKRLNLWKRKGKI